MDDSYDIITEEIRARQPHAREDYDPIFDREGTTRRVLGSITDEIDGPSGNRPRNTIDALAFSLLPDACVPGITGPTLETAEAQVSDEVDKLVNAGLVERRRDGTLALTDDGQVELSN